MCCQTQEVKTWSPYWCYIAEGTFNTSAESDTFPGETWHTSLLIPGREPVTNQSDDSTPWTNEFLSRLPEEQGWLKAARHWKATPGKYSQRLEPWSSPHNLQAAQQVWASPLGQPPSRPSSPLPAVAHCFYNLLSQTPDFIYFLSFKNFSS